MRNTNGMKEMRGNEEAGGEDKGENTTEPVETMRYNPREITENKENKNAKPRGTNPVYEVIVWFPLRVLIPEERTEPEEKSCCCVGPPPSSITVWMVLDGPRPRQAAHLPGGHGSLSLLPQPEPERHLPPRWANIFSLEHDFLGVDIS